MSTSRRLLPPPPAKQEPDVSLAIVNIVLLLILFFLATGAMMNSPSRGVNIAETLDLPRDQLPRPVLVIGDGGTLELDDAPIAQGDLAAALTGERALYVLIDRERPALELLELLATEGLERLDIHLVTAHKEEQP